MSLLSFSSFSLLQILEIIFASIFLLIVCSYYWLLLKKNPRKEQLPNDPSFTVIIPAHNEEAYIRQCLDSVFTAHLPKGMALTKENVFVINDGSIDNTESIIKEFPVTLLRAHHQGKANAINLALKETRTPFVAVIDADSVVSKNAFIHCLRQFGTNNTDIVISCATIKVANKNTFLGMWLHIEQLYNSLLRSFFAKINVNIVAPGPLSIYRKSFLDDVGGFHTQGFSEDVDIAIRSIKHGYHVAAAEKASVKTHMPVSLQGFFRQRSRFSRGWINIFKRHIRFDKHSLTIYTIPMALFWYVQAVVMSVVTLYKIGSGYLEYFVSKGIYFSTDVALFLFDWFSMLGVIKWLLRIIEGTEALTLFAVIGLASSLLIYPLYVLAIIRYEKKIQPLNVLALFFMFPFWFLIMLVNLANIFEIGKKHQYNRWHKQTVKMKKS